jgi:AcrR family transcriptional regulator
MSLTDGPPPMNRPVGHRSTRDRPAKAPLSENAVVDAALSILKSDGLEAVTMRRVAAALDTGAASLYVYVSGREGLLQAMLDRVTASIELDPPHPTRWRAQLHSLLRDCTRHCSLTPGWPR